MIYDVDYFINKFEVIPEEMWTTGSFTDDWGACCANGHLGMRNHLMCKKYATEEASAFQRVVSVLQITKNWGVSPVIDNDWGYSEKAAIINNGDSNEYKQPTPKQRILAALYDIKAMTESKDIDTGKKERIVYVAVPATITEQSKDLVLS